MFSVKTNPGNNMKFFVVLALCFAAASAAVQPLTPDQAVLVKSSWAQVKHSEVDILAAIFAANPDIQARFPQFVGKDVADLKDTAAFATHAGRIVGFFSEIIGLIGNVENRPAVETLVGQLSASHKTRGIPTAQFGEFRASLVAYLQANVSWGDNVAAAWNQALDNFFFVLTSNY
ncbi:globin CTT-VIIA-like [Chironomus tepperi]|uniref:globin CTT-VIIA-like n=1 Tax=Chironomus tepperi TaxID=113505 RepID=UPI00391F2951